jgi:hypothetical protein
MRKEIVMKALSPLPLKKKPLAKAFTAYTYDIKVDNTGTVSNHPSYVRVGDHVTWTIEKVVPSSVTITFLSPATDFFTSVSRTAGTDKVVYTASTVKAAALGKKIEYSISGTPSGPFTTPTMELMADDSGKPPGCYGCPTEPTPCKPPHPVHPPHPRFKVADREPGPGGSGAPGRRAGR